MSKKAETLSRTKVRSRQNLIDAFEKTFHGKPLEKISIKEITDTAGYNRSTFYLYFKDIYDLADAFEVSVLEEVAAVVSGVIDQNAALPLTELIGLMGPVASQHADRIYLCSQLPDFQNRFRSTLLPLYDAITRFDPKTAEHDFLLSLLSAILLHNITYLHDHAADLSAAEAIRLSRSLIAPGLQNLVTVANTTVRPGTISV